MDATLRGPHDIFKLGSTVIQVGRAPNNQLRLDDTQVSTFHAQIFPQGQGHAVKDLGSRNGTFVNEQRLVPNSPRQLTAGDTIRFGNTIFDYTLDLVPTTLMNTNTSQSDVPNWIKIAGGLASLATIFAAIWGIYIYLHPTPTSSSTSLVATSSIPVLAHFYQGTMNRINDGAVLPFNLQQLSENSNDGTFTASAVINGCPANVNGQIKADNTLTFNATQTNAGGCNGFEGEFRGVLQSDRSISGQWNVPNTQVGGSWSAKPQKS